MRKVKPRPGDEAAFRVAYLCAGFIRKTLTEKEELELDDWIAESMDNQRLFQELTDTTHLAEDMEKMRPLYEAQYGGTWVTRTIRKLLGH